MHQKTYSVYIYSQPQFITSPPPKKEQQQPKKKKKKKKQIKQKFTTINAAYTSGEKKNATLTKRQTIEGKTKCQEKKF